MSRVHSNIAEHCGRRLKKQYNNAGAYSGDGVFTGTKAIGINAPTTRSQAMGTAGRNGVVSFICNDGGNQAYTIYEWDSVIAALNTGDGWVKNGANVNEYQKTCDQLAKISFTISEGVDFCIQAATTPVTEALVSGAESGANPNSTDTSLGTTR